MLLIKSIRKKTIISLSLVIVAWLGLIFFESSQPPPKILGEIQGLDKFAHFVVYSILGAMILAILNMIDTYKKIPILPVSVILVLLAGIFDEFHQSYVPQRNVDGFDLFADFLGGIFSTVIVQLYLEKRMNSYA